MTQKIRQEIIDNLFLNSWKPFAWIIAIGFILYVQTLSYNFTYFDDHMLILDNQKYLSDASNIFTAFKEDIFRRAEGQYYYRPVLMATFIFDAQIGGVSPVMYHFSNMFFHLLASCLLFIFLLKMKYRRDLSLFFSLLFTVHPALTQAVAWIPGRNDLLMAIFALTAFVFFIDFMGTGNLKYYFLHIFFFIVSLFTKEVSLPLILLFVLYYFLIRKDNVFIRNYKILAVGWLAGIIVWFLMRSHAMAHQIPLNPDKMIASIFEGLPGLLIFAGKILLPINLSVVSSLKDSSLIYGIIVLVAIAGVLYLSKNKRYKFIIFGLIWFVIFLLPTFLNFVITNNLFFHEFRIYLPMVGAIIILMEIDIIKNLDFRKQKNLLISAIIIIIGFGLTFSYSSAFRNKIMLWGNAAETSPKFLYAQGMFGLKCLEENMLDKAEMQFKRILEIAPNDYKSHYYLGIIYARKNMLNEADEEFNSAISVNPSAQALCDIGEVYYEQGRFDKAESKWKKATEINPDYIDAYIKLAKLYYEQKNIIALKSCVVQLKKRNIDIPEEILNLIKK